MCLPWKSDRWSVEGKGTGCSQICEGREEAPQTGEKTNKQTSEQNKVLKLWKNKLEKVNFEIKNIQDKQTEARLNRNNNTQCANPVAFIKQC